MSYYFNHIHDIDEIAEDFYLRLMIQLKDEKLHKPACPTDICTERLVRREETMPF